ncbi:MAG: N-acetylmuramoyl-L-alanine amidase family protein [Acutalibacteraceae bacterium]
MNKFEMSNVERLMLKRKIARKKRIRRFIIILTVLALSLCVVFAFFIHNNASGKGLFKKKLNAKTLECPDYVDVQLINTGYARTGVKLIEVNNIVIHYVGNPGTTAQNNRDYFNKSDTEVCSHFVIGLEGEIIQCVPLDEKSNASNNRNLDTVSIEVCHPDASGKFTDASYESLVKLTAWLCDNSGLKAKDVIRHYDITGKECPKYFVDNESEWKNFLEDVKQELKNY